MPQITIRGIQADKICKISSDMLNELTEIIGCPRDYFTIDCLNVTSVYDNEITQTFPFISVGWFDRGQDIQDKVAKAITKHIKSLGIEDVEIAFTVFEKNKYYSNGEHY